jgi:hypothetical protein
VSFFSNLIFPALRFAASRYLLVIPSLLGPTS